MQEILEIVFQDFIEFATTMRWWLALMLSSITVETVIECQYERILAKECDAEAEAEEKISP